MYFEEIIKALDVVKYKSDDPFRQVACIIFDQEFNILAQGSNSFPKGILGIKSNLIEYEGKDDWRYYLLEHAERNAINDARIRGVKDKNLSLITSLFPCADCARAIVDFGIKKVFVPRLDEKFERNEKWKNHFFYSKEILAFSGIEIIYL